MLQKPSMLSLLDTIVLFVCVALTLFASDFALFQVSQILIMGIVVLGLYLLVQVGGQFSLGHGVFFAIGAYLTAILVEQYGFNVYLTLALAGLVSFGVGLLIGIPALRLEGVYLAIATFVLGAITPTILKLSVFEPLTGGVQGIYIAKPEVPFGIPLSQDGWLYCVSLLAAVAFFVVARNISSSRTGRALRAIKENSAASSSLGIDVSRYKVLVFGVSAGFAGVAGALNAVLVQFVAPEAFTIQLSISFLVALVVGSLAGMRGAFVGAAFVILIPNLTESVSKGLSSVVFGTLLVVLTCLQPVLRRRLARMRA